MPDSRVQSRPPQTLVNDVLAHIPNAVLVLSYPDFQLIYGNEAGQKILRSSLGFDDAKCDSVRASIPGPSVAVWRGYIRDTLEHGRCEHTHMGRKGRRWHLRFAKQPTKGPCTAITVTATELTDIDATRQQLTDSDLNYRTLFEAINTGVVYHRGDGQMISINPEAEAILGLKAADLLGWNPLTHQSLTMYEDGSICPREDHPLAHVVRTGQPHDNRLLGIPHPDGRRRWLCLSARPATFGPDGAVETAVVCFHDVTEQQELRQANEAQIAQLDRALEQSLAAMADIIDLRDPYTAGHQHNVGKLAANIAREMGLSESCCRLVRLAGIVHDIGKNAVPVEILARPGTLSPIEHALVQQHVEAGYKVLAGIEFAQPVANIMRQHHERLDGSGYPLGLSGDEVMLEARILAVADTVDAMTNHRPYRPARGLAAALAVLEQAAGVHYDADVVAAFKRIAATANRPLN